MLESRLRAATTEQRQLLRIRIVLEAADGSGTREIARELDTTPTTVSLWRGRFARERLDGLEDLPRSGTPPIYSEATDKRIRAVLDRPPPKGFARWNGPLIAKALGDVDVQYVWRSLRKHKIDLGGRKSWCESNDPEFASKAADVVGLYMAPPDNAVVICVDEKPSIQALERAQGNLKLPNGRTLTGHSHDYKRHGTTTLFAVRIAATSCSSTPARWGSKASCRSGWARATAPVAPATGSSSRTRQRPRWTSARLPLQRRTIGRLVDARTLQAIDEGAAAHGLTRSAFMASAALAKIQRGKSAVRSTRPIGLVDHDGAIPMTAVREFDAAHHFDNSAVIAAYLEKAFATGDNHLARLNTGDEFDALTRRGRRCR